MYICLTIIRNSTSVILEATVLPAQVQLHQIFLPQGKWKSC